MHYASVFVVSSNGVDADVRAGIWRYCTNVVAAWHFVWVSLCVQVDLGEICRSFVVYDASATYAFVRS